MFADLRELQLARVFFPDLVLILFLDEHLDIQGYEPGLIRLKLSLLLSILLLSLFSSGISTLLDSNSEMWAIVCLSL